MFKLIVKKSGHGKTKQFVDMITDASPYIKGTIVALEKRAPNLINLPTKVRLIQTQPYLVTNFTEIYGFICGLVAMDYDLEEVYIDDIFNICGKDFKALEEFLSKLSVLCNNREITFFIAVGDTIENLPESLRKHL